MSGVRGPDARNTGMAFFISACTAAPEVGPQRGTPTPGVRTPPAAHLS